MLKEERQALILNKLHSSGKVVVSRLAVELNQKYKDLSGNIAVKGELTKEYR